MFRYEKLEPVTLTFLHKICAVCDLKYSISEIWKSNSTLSSTVCGTTVHNPIFWEIKQTNYLLPFVMEENNARLYHKISHLITFLQWINSVVEDIFTYFSKNINKMMSKYSIASQSANTKKHLYNRVFIFWKFLQSAMLTYKETTIYCPIAIVKSTVLPSKR